MPRVIKSKGCPVDRPPDPILVRIRCIFSSLTPPLPSSASTIKHISKLESLYFFFLPSCLFSRLLDADSFWVSCNFSHSFNMSSRGSPSSSSTEDLKLIDQILMSKADIPDYLTPLRTQIVHELDLYDRQLGKKRRHCEMLGELPTASVSSLDGRVKTIMDRIANEIKEYSGNRYETSISVLNAVQNVHWVAVSFLVVGAALKTARTIEIKEEYLTLFQSMNKLSTFILLSQELPNLKELHTKLKVSIYSIVRGSILCCSDEKRIVNTRVLETLNFGNEPQNLTLLVHGMSEEFRSQISKGMQSNPNPLIMTPNLDEAQRNEEIEDFTQLPDLENGASNDLENGASNAMVVYGLEGCNLNPHISTTNLQIVLSNLSPIITIPNLDEAQINGETEYLTQMFNLQTHDFGFGEYASEGMQNNWSHPIKIFNQDEEALTRLFNGENDGASDKVHTSLKDVQSNLIVGPTPLLPVNNDAVQINEDTEYLEYLTRPLIGENDGASDKVHTSSKDVQSNLIVGPTPLLPVHNDADASGRSRKGYTCRFCRRFFLKCLVLGGHIRHCAPRYRQIERVNISISIYRQQV